VSSATAAIGNATWTTTVDGTTPELQKIKNWPTTQGEFFDAEDVNNMKRVAVLGITVVSNLFANGNAVGSTIRINGQSFTVIGVLEDKGSSGGSDQDDIIYIPLSTAQQRFLGSTTVRTINVQAESQEALTPLKNYITTLLRQRHRLAETADDDFYIRDMTEILSTIEDTIR
jgi:putative ABC transport system permease protein